MSRKRRVWTRGESGTNRGGWGVYGYNGAMFPRHMDIGSALRRIADRRIEEAIEQGKFEEPRGGGSAIGFGTDAGG